MFLEVLFWAFSRRRTPCFVIFRERDARPALQVRRVSRRKIGGASSEFQNKEVPPMEHFLLDVLAAIVAGIIVAWIVKRFINR